MTELTCVEVMDAAPAYALGVADDDTTSAVSHHVQECRDCREEVTRMEDSAVTAARPRFASEAGGSDRIAADTAADTGAADTGAAGTRAAYTGAADARFDYEEGFALPGRRRHLRRVAAMATIAVLVAGTALGGAVRIASVDSGTPGSTSRLYSGASTVGLVAVDGGRTPLIRLAVSGLEVSGPVSVESLSPDGSLNLLGSFPLHDGRGYWQGRATVEVSAASALLLTDPVGGVVATTTGP